MPKVILVAGSDWATGDELPEIDMQVMPRVGESVEVAGIRSKVTDVEHRLDKNADGSSVLKVRVLITPPPMQVLLG